MRKSGRDLELEACGAEILRLRQQLRVSEDNGRTLYNVLKALDERGHTQATWDLAKRAMAQAEKHFATSSQDQGEKK